MRNPAPISRFRHRQNGVVLFIALIAMVILSLAGIGLMRSVDTSTAVASNIAFRQGSIGPINNAIEVAIDHLFKSKTISQTANDTAQAYYAFLQPGENGSGVPTVLAGDYATMKAAYSGAGLPAAVVDAKTKMEVRAVIERICSAAGPVSIGTCDTLPPKVSPAGTDNKYGNKSIPLPPIRTSA